MGTLRTVGLHKDVGLDLRQPHGAQAEGLCGVGSVTNYGMGLVEGHSTALLFLGEFLQSLKDLHVSTVKLKCFIF